MNNNIINREHTLQELLQLRAEVDQIEIERQAIDTTVLNNIEKTRELEQRKIELGHRIQNSQKVLNKMLMWLPKN